MPATQPLQGTVLLQGVHGQRSGKHGWPGRQWAPVNEGARPQHPAPPPPSPPWACIPWVPLAPPAVGSAGRIGSPSPPGKQKEEPLCGLFFREKMQGSMLITILLADFKVGGRCHFQKKALSRPSKDPWQLKEATAQ